MKKITNHVAESGEMFQNQPKSKGLFITATGTDVGKTFATGLIVQKLRQAGCRAGYYKAALSGAQSIAQSDAGYVNRFADIGQPEETLVSYWYRNAVSPHLAAKLEGNPVELSQIVKDYQAVQEQYEYVTVEGSGGIVCPIRWDDKEHLLLEDIIKTLNLPTVVVADAGLGAINGTVLTVEYLRRCKISIKGVVLNRYTGGRLQEDNVRMIEEIGRVPVIACIPPGEKELQMDVHQLKALYE
ncbi:dethiobiotin synthase [Clostridium minihomine]|uniref:dethiobiotin synthase n=1 Tax=Clostridium minihomine TaxID=2045012 RepID=UPI001FB50978|nr:dethiobiotin synthase [Clostridium minihomine]